MYKEITINKLFDEVSRVKGFIIAKGYDKKQLIDLGTMLKERKGGIVEINWLDGADSGNYPSFESLRMKPRFVLKDGEIRSKTVGLIFLQSEPIILIVENFNILSKEDQQKYVERLCKQEKHDYNTHYYLHEDSIVVLGIREQDEMPKISYKLQVRSLM